VSKPRITSIFELVAGLSSAWAVGKRYFVTRAYGFAHLEVVKIEEGWRPTGTGEEGQDLLAPVYRVWFSDATYLEYPHGAVAVWYSAPGTPAAA
jgi:hypothetical protein